MAFDQHMDLLMQKVAEVAEGYTMLRGSWWLLTSTSIC